MNSTLRAGAISDSLARMAEYESSTEVCHQSLLARIAQGQRFHLYEDCRGWYIDEAPEGTCGRCHYGECTEEVRDFLAAKIDHGMDRAENDTDEQHAARLALAKER